MQVLCSFQSAKVLLFFELRKKKAKKVQKKVFFSNNCLAKSENAAPL